MEATPMIPKPLLDTVASRSWIPQFPQFPGISFPTDSSIQISSGTPVDPARFHAEAHHIRVLGTDFTYSATISAQWTDDLAAHLQFRLSDEGRYGVRLQAGRVELYSVLRRDGWPANSADFPSEAIVASRTFDRATSTVRLTITVEGDGVRIWCGPPGDEPQLIDEKHSDFAVIGVGRFAVYAIADTPTFGVTFTDVAATYDPTAATNFALLFSTPGYELRGSKRAIVRTIGDIDPEDLDDARSAYAIVRRSDGAVVNAGQFQADTSGARLTRSLGMQVLEIDFSDIAVADVYTIEVTLATSRGIRTLRSEPFEIREQLISSSM